jgi:hypothetical protein
VRGGNFFEPGDGIDGEGEGGAGGRGSGGAGGIADEEEAGAGRGRAVFEREQAMRKDDGDGVAAEE